ncbi:MAG: hypothetical protein M1330_05285, partial [Armatimonadetes bacterium]|nr:hypothetical protein [Armatimonadota bacterium]
SAKASLIFRWSLVRMALEQSSPAASRLRRTAAARTLDPSEKGAVNYFLGLTFCKLFAASLLNAPWLLHLDVFRPQLNPFLTGRSRPDFVGQNTNNEWLALECKGRISAPNEEAKQKAKDQAMRLTAVNGAAPRFHIGGIAYLSNEILRFYWRDPTPEPERVRNPVAVTVHAKDWSSYYAAALNLIRTNEDYFRRMLFEPVLMPVAEADLEIGIHPTVLRLILLGSWDQVRIRDTIADVQATEPHYHPDGLAVVAGRTWLRPLPESV